jgi:hypothetical protein
MPEMPDANKEARVITFECGTTAQFADRIRDIQQRTLRVAAERIDTKSMPGSWQATELRKIAKELEE